MDRRTFLKFTGLTLSGLVVSSATAQTGADGIELDVADIDRLNEALIETLGISYDDVQVSDIVGLNAPSIAESGANVPVEVSVDVPVDEVKAIHAFIDQNPFPHIFSTKFGPLASSAYFATRVRLAQTSPIRVLAETHSGQFYMASQVVRVTVGGCG